MRLLAIMMAATVLITTAHSVQAQEPTPEATPTEEPSRLGDVNCDGRIDSRDGVLVLQLDAGLVISDLCVEVGDINDDGTLNTIDAALILQNSAGLSPFPPTPPDPLPPPANGGLSIGSAEAAPGREGTVALEARAVTAPGLGAWTIDVEYDPAVVSVVRCSPEIGAVCNGEFASGILRLSGASAGGPEGDTKLADLTFTCADVGGVSDLTLTPRIFADATLGGPQAFVPTVTNGSITCAQPTPRPGYSQLDIVVINDLDGDGVRDLGEPGLEGWSVDRGCSDALLFVEPTDSEGRTSVEAYGTKECVHVGQLGWFLTSGPRSVNLVPGERSEVVFLLRKIAQRFFWMSGDLIVDGFPEPDSAIVDALVDGQSCGDARVSVGHTRSTYTLYILSAADRAGCAAEGQQVDVTVNGESVYAIMFTSNPFTNSEFTALVLGESPMWFFAIGSDGVPPLPYVGSVLCGEAREGALFYSPDYYQVYVLPDALRSGCGAPGRIVKLRAGDEVLRNVAWQEGFVPNESLQDVELPKTGAASGESAQRYGWQFAIVLAVAGLVLVAGGAVRWRVRRAA